MNKEMLEKLKIKLSSLTKEEKLQRNIYLSKLSKGIIEGPSLNIPSITKPWLKYYSDEQLMAPIPDMTAYEYMQMLNSNNQDAVAIEYLDKKITYKELFKKVNDTAKALAKIGVKPGEIVSIMLPACPEEVYLFYALDLIGACSNFIFPGTSLLEVEKNMNSLNCNKLFILSNLIEVENILTNNKKFQIITKNLFDNGNDQWDKFINDGYEFQIPIYHRNQDDPLFIAKTGGSTGKPKQVLLSDKCFNLQVQQHLNTDNSFAAGDRWLRLWPIFSASAAVSSNHLPLCYGMTLILEPTFNIENMDEIILRTRPSHMPLVVSCFDSLVNSPLLTAGTLSFMKSIGCGGETITKEFEIKAEKFIKKHKIPSCMTYGYGMTENASGATTRFSYETSSMCGVGIPQLNTNIGIFDTDTLEEMPYNQEGEICVQSNNFMLGYYNDLENTKKVLRVHSDGSTWLHSGDLGCVDENGHVFVKGRIKRVISLYNGHKVFPLEMESEIETLDYVKKAVVVSGNDPLHEGYLKPYCFVLLEKNVDKDKLLQDINTGALRTLPDYVRISDVCIVDNLPYTDIGKIDLKLLEKIAMGNTSTNKLENKVLKKQK